VNAGHIARGGPPIDEKRSRLMSRVRQRDTKPEMAVRRRTHALGFRFRLQRNDLPGRPDLVFPRLRKVLFVHGCFWHSHAGCKWATVPKTRAEYWESKFTANRARDVRVTQALREAGWEVGIIWECETRHPDLLTWHLQEFLAPRLDYLIGSPDHPDSVAMASEDR
jgi:DNA mismatch endonuclease, patch repair protein